ncbi:MGMT family protein [Candidatus Woesearchaeota archaeon]|nr:MGMT family protein [Candidatus Woesearchaeota archaeon]
MMGFNERVWEVTKQIPKGKVSTYKEIAKALNCRAYRAVGNALNKNPFAPIVPCHRVVSSNGGLGGFAYGVKAKIKILKTEGIEIKEDKIVEFEKRLFKLKTFQEIKR